MTQPLLGRLEPAALPAPGLDQHNPCRLHEQDTQVAIAALGYFAEYGAVAVEICLGTSPSQAKSRPFVNASPLPIAAIIALEMIGPIPGTPIKRSQSTFRRARTSISFDKLSMRPSSRRQSPRHPFCPIPDKPKLLDFQPVEAHGLHGASLTR
jgi:hypothetical protein